MYADFYSSFLTESHFDSRPMVVLIGPYSVGKTSFIKYLIGRSFPGERIGPEPTTDRFSVVMHGPDERVLPGNALAANSDTPFQPLSMFGTQFLNKLEAPQLPAPLLQRLTLVDTPGVLSGEKQREMRGYDAHEVTKWFIERADRILLLFDAHKLDISDEFKKTIELLSGSDDKVRIVLNKADATEPQELMRVYGALMWSLGSVVQTPEVILLGEAVPARGARLALPRRGARPGRRPARAAAQRGRLQDQRPRQARKAREGARGAAHLPARRDAEHVWQGGHAEEAARQHARGLLARAEAPPAAARRLPRPRALHTHGRAVRLLRLAAHPAAPPAARRRAARGGRAQSAAARQAPPAQRAGRAPRLDGDRAAPPQVVAGRERRERQGGGAAAVAAAAQARVRRRATGHRGHAQKFRVGRWWWIVF